MEQENIKKMLYNDFIKWYKINYWSDTKVKPTEKEIKIYLGHFGINRRGIIEYK